MSHYYFAITIWGVPSGRDLDRSPYLVPMGVCEFFSRDEPSNENVVIGALGVLGGEG